MHTHRYHTVSQIGERWGNHPESVRRLIREGKLPALRIGKRLRVSIADIETFENAHRVAPRYTQRSTLKTNK